MDVLCPELTEEHVHLSDHKNFCNVTDNRRIYRDVWQSHKSEYIVNGVQTSDWSDTHEVGHLDQSLDLEMVELPVFPE